MIGKVSPPMAVSLAGRKLRGTLVIWPWSRSRDTVVYVPFPRSSPTLAWSDTPVRWRVFRFLGPEWGWEDYHHEDDLRGRNTDGRRARRSRSRRLPPRAGDQTPHRGRPPGEQPRRRAQGRGEPAHLRQVLRSSKQTGAQEG